MPISVLDITKARVGEKKSYTGEDFDRAGVPMICGCQVCEATLGPWNSFPSKTGYIRCGECIYDLGFDTLQEFEIFSTVHESDSNDEND